MARLTTFARVCRLRCPRARRTARQAAKTARIRATRRDGRIKTVLGAAQPELVQAFLDGEVVEDLTGLYGDPARGFAGGYPVAQPAAEVVS